MINLLYNGGLSIINSKLFLSSNMISVFNEMIVESNHIINSFFIICFIINNQSLFFYLIGSLIVLILLQL